MQIEKLINDRKERLDVESPPAELWQSIRNEWKKENTFQDRFRWWKVAAILFMATSLGMLGYNLFLQNKVEQLASLGDISMKYAEMERAYEDEISKLEENLPINKVNEKDDFAWIFEELGVLEEINNTYRSDIGKNVDQDRLVKVLVDYYEKKIRLLKKLEHEIERKNKLKNNEKYTRYDFNS